ncbi:MAG: hypothetical protein H0U59_03930 [Gemmatimonadaceae bacterium]|nr:hypothetical protein [Gemmatimonadaceae bacterium]
MAIDTRVMTQPVAAGKKVYKPGQEAELAEALSQPAINELIGKGVLQGDWSGTAGVELESLAVDAAATPKAAVKK